MISSTPNEVSFGSDLKVLSRQCCYTLYEEKDVCILIRSRTPSVQHYDKRALFDSLTVLGSVEVHLHFLLILLKISITSLRDCCWEVWFASTGHYSVLGKETKVVDCWAVLLGLLGLRGDRLLSAVRNAGSASICIFNWVEGKQDQPFTFLNMGGIHFLLPLHFCAKPSGRKCKMKRKHTQEASIHHELCFLENRTAL